MACHNYALDMYLRHPDDTGKLISQPLIDSMHGFEFHWFYKSDQRIASTMHDWPRFRLVDSFCLTKDELESILPGFLEALQSLYDPESTRQAEQLAAAGCKSLDEAIARSLYL
ncbi:MAG: hypothetical protein ABIC95_06720 [archaeon]